MTLRNRIRQRIDEKYIGIAKQEMSSPIVDICLDEILKLIDEKIKDIVSKGEQMADATHDNYFNNMAQDRRLCLEELKEELEK